MIGKLLSLLVSYTSYGIVKYKLTLELAGRIFQYWQSILDYCAHLKNSKTFDATNLNKVEELIGMQTIWPRIDLNRQTASLRSNN